MRVTVKLAAKDISQFKVSEAKQITWRGVGTFQTSFLKKVFATLKQTKVEYIDVSLDGETVVIEYKNGSYRLNSEFVRGDVHDWRRFELESTEPKETESNRDLNWNSAPYHIVNLSAYRQSRAV